jgi:hypothetical protein
MHAVTNPRIRIDGDEATGTWYLLIARRWASSSRCVLGIYDETYQGRRCVEDDEPDVALRGATPPATSRPTT